MVMDNIREGVKKPWAKFLIMAIVISFVGAGYFTSAFLSGDPFAAAIVNDESVSRDDFQRAYQRMRQQYGEAYSQFVKTEEQERNFRENVLQNLIAQKVALQTAKGLGLRASNESIRKTIHAIPALQADGVYSSELLDNALLNIGMSREKFKNSIVTDLILQQLSNGVSASDFVLPSEMKEEIKVMGQARTGRALAVQYSLFDQNIELAEQEELEYYEANKESYRLQEKVSVDYIELSIDKLQSAMTASEEEVKAYYEENIARYQTDEERKVSHILVAINDDRNEADAKKKADEVKAKLDAGEDFVSLVKSSSDDEFSAENDGDLGIIAKGDMETEFETAMQSLENVGDVSDPVKTSFGYHIIKLTELIAGETQPLNEVKEQVILAIKKQKAEEAYFVKSQTLEEKAYEISDSLKDVAELIDVKVETSPLFGRAFATGLFAEQTLRDEAFSPTVLEEQVNSNLIAVGENHVVVMRLNTHQPSEIQPFESVKTQVIAKLKADKAKEAAVAYAQSILEKLKQNESVDELLARKSLAWKDLDNVKRQSAALPYTQLQAFFKMNKAKSDSSASFKLIEDNSSAVVLVLNAVVDGDFSKEEKAMIDQTKQRLDRFFGQASYSSLVEEKRAEADVTRNLANIEQ